MIKKITIPALSPTMTDGIIKEWKVREGDEIKAGDVLFVLETDKTAIDFESIDEGKIGKILWPAEKKAPVGKLVGIIIEDQDTQDNVDRFIKKELQEDNDINNNRDIQKSVQDAPSPKIIQQNNEQHIKSENQHDLITNQHIITNIDADFNNIVPNTLATTNTSPFSYRKIKASPVARILAVQHTIDLSNIQGTGYNNIITQKDVEKLILSNNLESNNIQKTNKVPESSQQLNQNMRNIDGLQSTKIIKNVSNVRKIIANRLQSSFRDCPHFYLSVDCDITDLLILRNQLNNTINILKTDNQNDIPTSETLKNYTKITVNDFIIKATAGAIRECMWINASWELNDEHTEQIIQYNDIDICIAVSIEDGLITPIIRQADKINLMDISNITKNLIIKARNGSLAMNEFQGGTFTISNLGMFNIKNCSAIINPPQSCILAVGSVERRPIVQAIKNHSSNITNNKSSDNNSIPKPTEGIYSNLSDNEQIVIRNIINLTLSIDHRVVDGVKGAQFLNKLKFYIENPLLMLI